MLGTGMRKYRIDKEKTTTRFSSSEGLCHNKIGELKSRISSFLLTRDKICLRQHQKQYSWRGVDHDRHRFCCFSYHLATFFDFSFQDPFAKIRELLSGYHFVSFPVYAAHRFLWFYDGKRLDVGPGNGSDGQYLYQSFLDRSRRDRLIDRPCFVSHRLEIAGSDVEKQV